MKRYLALFLYSFILAGQVSAPNAGSVRFSGQVFAVHGIPANLLVANAPWTSAAGVSFSDAGGLLSENRIITLIGPDGAALAGYSSDEAAPVLNIDGPLQSAIVWLPSKHTLLHWNGAKFIEQQVNEFAFDGLVTYLHLPSPGIVRFLVTHADASVSAVTVSLETGEVLSADLLPSAHGRAFIQHSFVLFEDKQGLVVESASGLHRAVTLSQYPLPEGDLILERMSTDWLHIFSASMGKHWALYLTDKDLHLSALPVPSSVVEAATVTKQISPGKRAAQ